MNIFRILPGRLTREKELIALFRREGALSIELARRVTELGDVNRLAFNKLLRRGVIESGGGDTYFLNDQGLMRFRMGRIKWAMIFLFAMLSIIILIRGTG